jgi:probable rRNA maturation factor
MKKRSPAKSEHRPRGPRAPAIDVELANRQTAHTFQPDRLIAAARTVLAGEGIRCGTLSLVVVDDKTMRRLNRRYLQHDYATDVLSFLLDSGPGRVQGEVIVSADTAARQAPRYGWSAEDELLLYVIHGTLHVVGYDDTEPAAEQMMRDRERHYLALG